MEMLKTCLKYFMISRIIYVLIILICINQSFVGEYDKANYLLKNSDLNEEDSHNNFNYYDINQSQKILEFDEYHFLERIFLKITNHFNSYDTIHFLHNTRSGYTNEKNYVFFPLISRVIEILENTFKNISYFKNQMTLFLIIGLLVSNTICFINGLLFIR